MTRSLTWCKKKLEKYDKLSKTTKLEVLDALYCTHRLTWVEIATEVGTYPAKIRRDAKKLGIKSRTKSETQQLALEKGKKHPTKGTKRSEETKHKIADSVADMWENMDDDERERRPELTREQWNNMSEAEKAEFQRKSRIAIRKTLDEGSKLEKAIKEALIENNYQVEFHTSRFIRNQNLQVDIFLPILNTAVEVDGPSHTLPVYGDEALTKQRAADAEKDGLILGAGLVMIRVRHDKTPSKRTIRQLTERLLKVLGNIEKTFPEQGHRRIVIE